MLDTCRRDGWNWYSGEIELRENSDRLGYGEFDENAARTVLRIS